MMAAAKSPLFISKRAWLCSYRDTLKMRSTLSGQLQALLLDYFAEITYFGRR